MNHRQSTSNNIFDCVSATELCTALNKLKKLAAEDRVSQQKSFRVQQNNQLNNISFNDQLNDSKSFYDKKDDSLSFKFYQEKIYQNKKKQIDAKTLRKSNISKSPFNNTNHKDIKIVKQKKELRQPVKDKQIKNAHIISRQSIVGIKSKQILKNKEKNGQKYIPIHLRTQSQIRKKKQIIEKIKDQIQIKQNNTLKQCTFKPAISKTNTTNRKDYYVKEERLMTQSIEPQKYNASGLKQINIRQKQNILHNQIKETKEIKQKNSLTPRKLEKSQVTLKKTHVKNQNNEPEEKYKNNEQQKKKNYKNKSFNLLLDMIH